MNNLQTSQHHIHQSLNQQQFIATTCFGSFYMTIFREGCFENILSHTEDYINNSMANRLITFNCTV